MPYKLEKKGKKYSVQNTESGKVFAKSTTKAKADAQIRLLEMLESRSMKNKK
jgi:hypothetical protein